MSRTKESLAAEYMAKIGYDPFADDPTISVDEVARILAEYDAIAAAESRPSYVLNLSAEERDTVAHALSHMAQIAVETCPTLATARAQVEGINAILSQLGATLETVPTE